MPSALAIDTISKSYNETKVIKDLSLDLPEGYIGCLIGESGCGKTTLLRCIAGFEGIHSGAIRIKESLMSDPKRCISPEYRNIGMVFQDYALFPHLRVRKNIAFGLEKLSQPSRKRRIAAMLELVGLAGEAEKYPHELSGGQQQRVALARALAPEPDLLLMDEPFSNLDVTRREQLCLDVRNILKELGTSALLVTHSQHEAFAMAESIGVMRNGSLEQWDNPYNCYHRPKSHYVADFVGEGVFIDGLVLEQGRVQTQLGTLSGPFASPCSNGCQVEVLIRPDDILHDEQSPLKGTVLSKRFRGANILYSLQLKNSENVLVLISSHHNHSLGQEIGIVPQLREIILFQARAF